MRRELGLKVKPSVNPQFLENWFPIGHKIQVAEWPKGVFPKESLNSAVQPEVDAVPSC